MASDLFTPKLPPTDEEKRLAIARQILHVGMPLQPSLLKSVLQLRRSDFNKLKNHPWFSHHQSGAVGLTPEGRLAAGGK